MSNVSPPGRSPARPRSGELAAAVLPFDDPRFQADPYPWFRALRERSPAWESPEGIWYLTAHADVGAALKHPQMSRDSGGVNPLNREARAPNTTERMVSRWMIFRDPPDHTRLRALMHRHFTPRAVAALAPRIRALATGLLERPRADGRMDAVADFAYPLTVSVICELLGIPSDDLEPFRRWAASLNMALDNGYREDMERCLPAIAEMQDYFRELAEKRRARPAGGLLEALLAVAGQPEGMSHEEWIAQAVFLLWAGHETTKHLIANGLFALLHHPAELARLRANPTMMESAVEELLRFESPVQKVGRWTRDDVEIGATRIPEGRFVVSLVGAANRDPAQFREPERLDLARQPNRHLAFSIGIHHCLGAGLARLEAGIAFRALLDRLPRLEPGGEPTWRAMTSLRALDSLPVAC